MVVPGGGRFADAVREAQTRWEFDDVTAHRMAILAMAQYGCMLAALEPRLVPAATLEAIGAALAGKHGVIWQPETLTIRDTAGIVADWQMTSDSLAAWLAGRLGVRRLALVKSAPPPDAPVRCDQATARGVVDARLNGLLIDHGISACWLGRADHGRFADILADAALPLTPLLV